MTKLFAALLLSGLFCLVSCQNNPQAAQSNNASAAESANKSAIPDPNDLLKVLQGNWRNEQDSAYVLEISDTQMTHTRNGSVVLQASLDIDGACQSPVCKSGDVDTSDGWCFTEMSIQKGKYHAACMFVVQCDANRLQYRPLGDTGNGLSFKKIP
jgi:hypothetical protein